jgi:anti-sigma factor RsiW
MKHPHLESQLDAYLDGELAPADARETESHLAQCPECKRFLDSRLALRSAIAARVPALPAPSVLRENVRKSLGARRVKPAFVWRALAIAASLAVFAFGGWQLGFQRGVGETLADEVLTSHIRSLMPGHLTDVQSSDQHTVKPWFNGRLDFSPPVADFAGEGYPLVGGRLDYVAGRSISALVYGRRQHVINVLLWPRQGGIGTRGPAVQTRQGYHVLHWTTADYTYWVVSDLGLAELQQFSLLLQRADSAAYLPAR